MDNSPFDNDDILKYYNYLWKDGKINTALDYARQVGDSMRQYKEGNSYSNLDLQNISGKKLAEYGKEALRKGFLSNRLPIEEVKMTDISWLNKRVEEVCSKGRL